MKKSLLIGIKWVKIYKNIWLGLFGLGFILFFIQEIPYLIMPFIKLANNPLMEMVDTYPLLNIFEKIIGISTVISMIFLVNSNTNEISHDLVKTRIFFSMSIISLLGYYIGWVFYFNGFQGLPIVLILLTGCAPLYYTSIGLWRKNYILVLLGILFLFVHLANVWTSY
ncbi:MAG: hypothetical protein FWH54_02350 [Methanobrevibacter sp.]|nr:hypothetical protein [Methanobrevibacter sp.]